jgi:hypothetical protein
LDGASGKREHLRDSALESVISRVEDLSKPIKAKDLVKGFTDGVSTAHSRAVCRALDAIGERLVASGPRSKAAVEEKQELAHCAWKLVELKCVQATDSVEEIVSRCVAVIDSDSRTDSLILARCAKAIGTAVGARCIPETASDRSLATLTGLLNSAMAPNCGRHGSALALALALPGLSSKSQAAVASSHSRAVKDSRMTKPLRHALKSLALALKD